MTMLIHEAGSRSKMKESIRLVIEIDEIRSHMRRMVKQGDSLGGMAARNPIPQETREALLHRRHSFWSW